MQTLYPRTQSWLAGVVLASLSSTACSDVAVSPSDKESTNTATQSSTTAGLSDTTTSTTSGTTSTTSGTTSTTSGTSNGSTGGTSSGGTSSSPTSSETTTTASGAGGTTSGGVGGSTSTSAGGSGGGSTTGATPSTGCGSPAPASEGYQIDADGLTREYILRVPDNYDPTRPYPLVFAWHPWGGSAQQIAGSGYYGLQSVAGDDAILVSPEGIDFNGNGLGWANPNGRDEKFMRAMLERFQGELCVDGSRVFSTGFSFGGMMSFALGCDAADVIRAVAPQAGNSSVSGCGDSDLPVALMGFHGTDDTVVTIEGGRTWRDRILQRNGCSQSTTPIEGGWCDDAGQNYQPCSCVSYDGCQDGYPVIWCEFTGPHTPAPNSGQALWDFFSQF